MKKIILFLTIFTFFSCGEDLTPAYKIEEIRVLAVKADSPEVYPKEAVNFSLLLGQPEEFPEYHQIWLLCDPGVFGESQMGAVVCSENISQENIIDISAIDSENFQITVPEDTLTKDNLKSKYLYAIHALCIDSKDECNKMLELNEIPWDRLKISIKRIRIIENDVQKSNKNPVLESVYLDGEDFFGLDTLKLSAGKSILKAMAADSSFEQKETADGKKIDEKITFYWYSSKGEFENGNISNQIKGNRIEDLKETKFNLKEDEKGSFNLYLIVQDDRGGADWKKWKVNEE